MALYEDDVLPSHLRNIFFSVQYFRVNIFSKIDERALIVHAGDFGKAKHRP